MRPVYLGSLVLTMLFSPLLRPGVCGWSDQLWSNFYSGDNCGGASQGCSGAAQGCCSGCASQGRTNCLTCCPPNYGPPYQGACSPRSTCPHCGVVGTFDGIGCRMCGYPGAGGIGGNRRAIRPVAAYPQALGGENCGPAGVNRGGGRTRGGVRRPGPTAAMHAGRPGGHVMRSVHKHCANGVCCGGAVGPEYGAVTYPYYTTRGPRDFFLANPATIGP